MPTLENLYPSSPSSNASATMSPITGASSHRGAPTSASRPIDPEIFEKMIEFGLADVQEVDGEPRIVLTPEGSEQLRRLLRREKPTKQGQRFIRSIWPFAR